LSEVGNKEAESDGEESEPEFHDLPLKCQKWFVD